MRSKRQRSLPLGPTPPSRSRSTEPKWFGPKLRPGAIQSRIPRHRQLPLLRSQRPGEDSRRAGRRIEVRKGLEVEITRDQTKDGPYLIYNAYLSTSQFGWRKHAAQLKVKPYKRFDGKRVPTVAWIKVEEDARLRGYGIATTLYELAAQDACRIYRKPLHSDTLRSAFSQGFWKKQTKVGRARCLRDSTDEEAYRADTANDEDYVQNREGCVQYSMKRCTVGQPDLRGAKVKK